MITTTSEHAPNDTLIDLDPEGQSDLLGDAHTAEPRIAPLEIDDGGDEFRGRTPGAGLSAWRRRRGEELAVLPLYQGLVELEQRCRLDPVLDTNVVLSALLFSQGRLARLRLAWRQAEFHPLVSKATTEELMRALAYPKFKLTVEEQRELLADYLPYCTTVNMPAKPPRTPPCRNAFDVPFVQLAVGGNADYIVNGDRDLLSLRGSISSEIVTAEAFLGSFDRR